MCGRAGAITLASITIALGIALPAAADPLAQKALPPPTPAIAAPAPAEPGAAMPVRSVFEISLPPSPADRAEPAAALRASETVLPRPEPMDRAERQRVLSYILLQGLQGAGPFTGAR